MQATSSHFKAPPRFGPPSRLETVFAAAQSAFEVPQSAFFQRRTRFPSAARAAAICFLCLQEELPLVRIGEALGRDHTTVLYHREQHVDRIRSDPLYREGYERMLRLMSRPRPAAAADARRGTAGRAEK